MAGLVYWLTFSTIRIVDGDQFSELRTHNRTVESILAEAGISLADEDIVVPQLASVVDSGLVSIKRAHLVRVQVDDSAPVQMRTQIRSAVDLLGTLGYKPSAYDRVTVDDEIADALPAQSSAIKKPTEIVLRRSTDVIVTDKDQTPITARTTARTVGEALMQNGFLVYLADYVNPALSEPLKSGMNISIDRARVVDVIVDGRRVRTRTHRDRIGDVLTELNVILYDSDYTSPGLDTLVTDNIQVQLIRVRRELEINQSPIPFESLVQPDNDVELDQYVLAQDGVPGVRERRTQVTYENGAEVQREIVADFVPRAVQNKINKFGTKVVVRSLDTPEGPVNYWRIIRMDATTYSPSTAGVSRNSKYFGITRCGIPMRKGIVAVDPSVIPLRTNVYVPNYGIGLACDTGGAINGKHIDLGFDDSNLELFRRPMDVYILTPVPARIRYRLD